MSNGRRMAGSGLGRGTTPGFTVTGQFDAQGFEDLTGQAGVASDALEIADSNRAAAGAIGTGITAAAQIGTSVAQGLQSKRLREEAYQQGLNEIYKAQKEAERQQRLAEKQADMDLIRTKGGLILDQIQRDLTKRQKNSQRALQAIDNINARARYDEDFKDALRGLGRG